MGWDGMGSWDCCPSGMLLLLQLIIIIILFGDGQGEANGEMKKVLT
jgi:hypothetical protein